MGEGGLVGLADGAPVTVGPGVGAPLVVGPAVGALEGASVTGLRVVGLAVGEAVGLAVGAAVGLAVGDAVGLTVGGLVAAVGAGVAQTTRSWQNLHALGQAFLMFLPSENFPLGQYLSLRTARLFLFFEIQLQGWSFPDLLSLNL